MKKLLVIIPMLFVIGVAFAAWSNIYVKKGTTFYADSTWYDTTATIDAKDYNSVYFTTYFQNTTTTDYTAQLLGYMGNKWVLLKTYTTDSNKTTPITKTIITPDTNYLGGMTKFRIVNVIAGGDSSNLLKYWQSVSLKKVNK